MGKRVVGIDDLKKVLVGLKNKDATSLIANYGFPRRAWLIMWTVRRSAKDFRLVEENSRVGALERRTELAIALEGKIDLEWENSLNGDLSELSRRGVDIFEGMGMEVG
ncbi:hypothetical protein V6N12_034543 [Hibiscus sabdariffa]|uniref:Uncharacterized protein n=1 Tax=Hibiscus sabdariffa TaxID=183260 RepID=A0ABR2DHG6_9ROSI